LSGRVAGSVRPHETGLDEFRPRDAAGTRGLYADHRTVAGRAALQPPMQRRRRHPQQPRGSRLGVHLPVKDGDAHAASMTRYAASSYDYTRSGCPVSLQKGSGDKAQLPSPRRAEPARQRAATLDQAEAANTGTDFDRQQQRPVRRSWLRHRIHRSWHHGHPNSGSPGPAIIRLEGEVVLEPVTK